MVGNPRHQCGFSPSPSPTFYSNVSASFGFGKSNRQGIAIPYTPRIGFASRARGKKFVSGCRRCWLLNCIVPGHGCRRTRRRNFRSASVARRWATTASSTSDTRARAGVIATIFSWSWQKWASSRHSKRTCARSLNVSQTATTAPVCRHRTASAATGMSPLPY